MADDICLCQLDDDGGCHTCYNEIAEKVSRYVEAVKLYMKAIAEIGVLYECHCSVCMKRRIDHVGMKLIETFMPHLPDVDQRMKMAEFFVSQLRKVAEGRPLPLTEKAVRSHLEAR